MDTLNKARKKGRLRPRRELTPEEAARRKARKKWWRWSELYNHALTALIEHHPMMEDIVARATKIADDGVKASDEREPPEDEWS